MTDGVGAVRVAVVALAVVLTGCQTAASWFRAEQPPRAHYVGAAGAALHREPDATSDVIGRLSLHEGVLAYRTENGFAYVRAESDGREGWVQAGALLDDLPAARKPAEPTEPASRVGAEAPVAEPAPESLPEEPEAPQEPEPERPPEKSVFDPF